MNDVVRCGPSRAMRGNMLIVFAKEPRIGRAKTRLAADIGLVAAWSWQRRTMARLFGRLGRDPRWLTWVAVSPDRAARPGRAWPAGARLVGQGRGDLGARMARVLRRLPPGPAVIVGTDIPDLDAGHVARAFRALGRADAVVGPAADGGYWLIGLAPRWRRRDVFAGVRWSSAHARADTIANLKGARVSLLDVLEDIDDGATLARRRS